MVLNEPSFSTESHTVKFPQHDDPSNLPNSTDQTNNMETQETRSICKETPISPVFQPFADPYHRQRLDSVGAWTITDGRNRIESEILLMGKVDEAFEKPYQQSAEPELFDSELPELDHWKSIYEDFENASKKYSFDLNSFK